jgi:hypothetical protein
MRNEKSMYSKLIALIHLYFQKSNIFRNVYRAILNLSLLGSPLWISHKFFFC